MSAGELQSPTGWSRARGYPRAVKFLPLSHLRRLRGCEQVAAVCYRVRGRRIEFLLVQTRGGRWTFPKGSAEPGLTTAQAAALEAFEEAGVHGRMEEASFARYMRSKRRIVRTRADIEFVVTAHLCEVLSLEPPQESERNRTWFSAEKAKRRLREGRPASYGAEVARVVDRAVTRVKQLCSRPSACALRMPQIIDIESFRSTARDIKALGPAKDSRRPTPKLTP